MKILWSILLGVALVGAGCTTVIPERVTTDQASFDGQDQNSGFVGYAVDGRMIVTANWRERYNALIPRYASKLTVPVQADAGLTPLPNGQWLATNQAVENFLRMNHWRKQDAK